MVNWLLKLKTFFFKNSRAISLIVAFVGLAVFIAGPVRSWIAGAGPAEQDDPAVSALTGITGNGGGTGGQPVVTRELEPFTTIPDRPRDTVIGYEVQPGDTLEGIARRYSLDRNTLFWANSNTLGDNVHFLQTGVTLNILPVDGVYHVCNGKETIKDIAADFEVEPEVIIESPYNELEGYQASDSPPWGMKLVIPGGQREIVDWRPPIIETVDAVTGAVSYGFMVGMSGSCSSSISGGGGTGAWIAPVNSYMVTQAYYPGHSGIDLGAVLGEPVMAADTGVVIFSGWVPPNWGYGILVVLDHGNGWTSYYAHLNSTAVGCGTMVSRGQTIGYVGSTGQSSGPHLHFEMRWSHTPDNPAMYIGF